MDLQRFDCIAKQVYELGRKNYELSSFAQDAWTHEQWTFIKADHGYTRKLINAINGKHYLCDYQNKITEWFPEMAG